MKHTQSRAVRNAVIAVNGVAVVLLLVLITSDIGARDYSRVVIAGPVFLDDLVLLFLGSIGPITIGTVVLANSPKAVFPVVLFLIASVTGVLSYANLPSVRREFFLTRASEAKSAVEGLEGDSFLHTSDPDFYRRSLKEAQMFHSIYSSQCEFLYMVTNTDKNKTGNLRDFHISLFFGILSATALFNCLFCPTPHIFGLAEKE